MIRVTLTGGIVLTYKEADSFSLSDGFLFIFKGSGVEAAVPQGDVRLVEKTDCCCSTKEVP